MWGSVGLDPMLTDDYDEESTFPSVKPNIDVLLPPHRARKQGGWYQVVQLPSHNPAQPGTAAHIASGVDVPPEIIDAILDGFWYHTTLGRTTPVQSASVQSTL